jgi:hypothetical protein
VETWLDMAGNDRNQAGNASSPANDVANDHEGLSARLATNAALFALIPFLLAGKNLPSASRRFATRFKTT